MTKFFLYAILHSMLEQELIHFGLSEKQAKVYLALLELGKSSVQDVAKHAKVNRATTYVMLDELMQKGLVSTYDQGKKTYFIAESPERLLSILETQRKEIENKEREISSIIPQLKEKHQTTDEGPVVRFLEGREGMKIAVKELLSKTKSKKVYSFYNVGLIDTYFSEAELKDMRSVRLQKKLDVDVLAVNAPREMQKSRKGDRVIKVETNKYPSECDFALYDDKIRIFSFANRKHPIGIIIHDKAMYESMLSLFKLAWRGAQLEEKN